MYRGSDEEPKVIDESKPSTWSMRDAKPSVFLKNTDGRPVNWAEFEARLRCQQHANCVEHVLITASSYLPDLLPVRAFSRVKSILVEGRKIETLAGAAELHCLRRLAVDTYRSARRSLALLPVLKVDRLSVAIAKEDDIQYISACKAFDILQISRYPCVDLRPLHTVSCPKFGVSGSKLQNAAGSGSRNRIMTIFGWCASLQDVGGLTTMQLAIDHCQGVDLNTIGKVTGLDGLRISCHKKIHSLEFLANCTTLRHLVISGSTYVRRAWDPVISSQSLQTAWLGPPVTDEEVRSIGEKNVDITISNGRMCYSEGQQVSVDTYYGKLLQLDVKKKKGRKQGVVNGRESSREYWEVF
jgi:hypothetical protein